MRVSWLTELIKENRLRATHDYNPPSPAESTNPVVPSIVVVTVHGTFDSHESETGSRWWQRDSQFSSQLIEALARHGISNHEIIPLQWSGANSDIARLDASERLSGILNTTNHPVAIIGHSHGGNIILDALSKHTLETNPFAVASLGTPFLQRKLKIIPLLIAFLQIAISLTICESLLLPGLFEAAVLIKRCIVDRLCTLHYGYDFPPPVILLSLPFFLLLYLGIRKLGFERRARRNLRQNLMPSTWLTIRSVRDEAIAALAAVSADRRDFLTDQAGRLAANTLGILLSALIAVSLIIVGTIDAFHETLIGEREFTVVIATMMSVGVYALSRLVWTGFNFLIIGRLYAKLYNGLLRDGIRNAAFGADGEYDFSSISDNVPTKILTVESVLTEDSLGGITEDVITERFRTLYRYVWKPPEAGVAKYDPNDYWSTFSGALFHNAYMSDLRVIEMIAAHIASAFACNPISTNDR